MRRNRIRFPQHILIPAIFLILASLTIPHSPAQNSDIGKTRSLAASQHEIVVILIKKKEFDKAAEEANKIFQMKWPDDQQLVTVLLNELLDFAAEFDRNSQDALAVRLLETNLNTFKVPKDQAKIWQEKGFLLEKMGKHDEALACFREAMRLEGKVIRQKVPIE